MPQLSCMVITYALPPPLFFGVVRAGHAALRTHNRLRFLDQRAFLAYPSGEHKSLSGLYSIV
jgi:hypothetical protein